MDIRTGDDVLDLAVEAWPECPSPEALRQAIKEIYGIFDGDAFVGAVIYHLNQPHLIIHPSYRGRWVSRSILNNIMNIGFRRYPVLQFVINKKHGFMRRMMALIGAAQVNETETHWIFEKAKHEAY